MPTFVVTVQEVRTFEFEAASEDKACAAFDEETPEAPLGAEKSSTRTIVSVERIDSFTSYVPADTASRDPSSEPTIPTPRAM